MAKLVQKITQSNLHFNEEDWALVSPEAIDLIRQMLTKDPTKRPSASECLNHKWLQHQPTTFLGYAGEIFKMKKTSSFLGRTSLNLKNRVTKKKTGHLEISQKMTVKGLIQDLLRNGIDLSILNHS